jgi:hypothetical protein
MKIVRVHTAALCILGLVSGVPALANQAGTSLVKPANQAGTSTVKAGPAASGVPAKARCEVDEMLGSVSCD